ncbi:hypothetical protein [Streptosporangium sp. H16]|uniref:hypothetical protein n=1 Tax=Streptosporangium sp. H16 TaxID=3444184 RepID=UPI003F7AC2EC
MIAAVKLLHVRFTEETHARSRFARELAAARKVDAFCTARVLAADLDGEAPYIASELIEGPSLREIVERDGPLAGEALERLAVGTATALTAIHHAGIAHRDVLARASERIDTLKDLRGKRICLSPGQTTGTMIRERGVDFVDVRGPDPAQCASQVADGSADAMVGDDLLIAGFGARLCDVKVEIAGLRLTTERYGVALRSGDPVACRKINEVITSMYADGTMERLLEEHLGRVGFRFETARPRLETC